MKNLVLKMISFYSEKISPLFPARCRYYPTCSAYCYQAVEKYGLFKGGILSIKRLSRCNILFPGGVDPLPEIKQKSKNPNYRK